MVSVVRSANRTDKLLTSVEGSVSGGGFDVDAMRLFQQRNTDNLIDETAGNVGMHEQRGTIVYDHHQTKKQYDYANMPDTDILYDIAESGSVVGSDKGESRSSLMLPQSHQPAPTAPATRHIGSLLLHSVTSLCFSLPLGSAPLG